MPDGATFAFLDASALATQGWPVGDSAANPVADYVIPPRVVRQLTTDVVDSPTRSALERGADHAPTLDLDTAKVAPPEDRSRHLAANNDSRTMTIQIWEGQVLSVDAEEGVMHVRLMAKMGNVPAHDAEIELQWVSQQDRDLLVPGGVFYLTQFKEYKRGTIRNSEEIQFRRLPSWSKSQVSKFQAYADVLHARIAANAPAQSSSE